MSLNIKNPICLIQNKVKKVVVDNVNLTIDVYTSEVPSEEPETPSYPTDLTGYMVTVPANWSCVAGYGMFNVNAFINGSYFEHLLIGYLPSGLESNDSITDLTSGYVPSENLLFSFTGGSDVTNQDLIQWFVNNNATFTYDYSGGGGQ